MFSLTWFKARALFLIGLHLASQRDVIFQLQRDWHLSLFRD